ncbi:MAG: tetratricopeptide repeat protein, partial [Opitutaceae bacterium]
MKNANLDAAVNLEVKDGTARFGFNTTKEFPAATVRLKAGDKVMVEEQIAINPGKPYTKQIAVPAGIDPHDMRASLSAGGREIVGYSPVRLVSQPQPPTYTPPPAPKDIANAEELVLAGQRADQFHSPTLDADPFWAEALRRDPGAIEANTGMGRLALRRAKFAEAEKHFRTALARLAANHTTPKNAEPLYYLGVALKAQGKTDEAFDTFYKAAWSQEWKSPAYFALAEIASLRGDFTAALKFADQSLDANALNVRAYGLKAAALRHLGRKQEALDAITRARSKTDPLDVRLMAEAWLQNDSNLGGDIHKTFRDFSDPILETAIEYANAGLWSDGAQLLEQQIGSSMDKGERHPLELYCLGYFAERQGDSAKAAKYRRFAEGAVPDYVFPFQSELIPVLRRAMEANPQDARAPYYLGNLLFDWQPAEAIALWERSVALDPKFPIAWRNLAEAWSHQDSEAAQAKAIAALEKTVALGDSYPTHFAELDTLYRNAGTPVEKRLALLDAHRKTVAQKDEGLAALVSLETFAGRPDDAIALLQSRTFSIWEGGTRFNTGQAWTDAHLVRGLQRFKARQFREALADFETSLKYPANLRATETRGGSRQAEINYWLGVAQAALGQADAA